MSEAESTTKLEAVTTGMDEHGNVHFTMIMSLIADNGEACRIEDIETILYGQLYTVHFSSGVTRDFLPGDTVCVQRRL